MINENYSIKQCILNYAQNHEQFEINQLVTELGMKINTARQYLSALTKNKQIVRLSRKIVGFMSSMSKEKLTFKHGKRIP